MPGRGASRPVRVCPLGWLCARVPLYGVLGCKRSAGPRSAPGGLLGSPERGMHLYGVERGMPYVPQRGIRVASGPATSRLRASRRDAKCPAQGYKRSRSACTPSGYAPLMGEMGHPCGITASPLRASVIPASPSPHAKRASNPRFRVHAVHLSSRRVPQCRHAQTAQRRTGTSIPRLSPTPSHRRPLSH